MKKPKNTTLTHTYYCSFLMLVVIPLILVFLIAEIVVGCLIRSASMLQQGHRSRGIL